MRRRISRKDSSMTRLRKLLGWAVASALLLVIHPARAQTSPQPQGGQSEEDLTSEAHVSTDDLWGEGDEEEAQAAEEEEEAAPAKVPWRGTSVSYGHEAALRPFLVRGGSADPTYNPYYAHSLTLAPGWNFNDHWRLGANVGLSQELTNPDDRTNRWDVWVSSGASLSYAKLVELYEISFNPKLGVTFPTTPAQQVATLYFALSPGWSVSRDLDVLQGLSLSWGFSFTKNFHRYAEASSPPQPIGCESATDKLNCTTTSTGSRNTNFSFANSLSATLGLVKNLSVGISVSAGQAKAYSLTPANMNDALTGDHNGVTSTSAPIAEHDEQGGWRYSQSFGVSVDYTIVSYLSASFGITTAGPQLDPSSQTYNPFLPNRNTTAGLSLSLALDTFVQEMGPRQAARPAARVASSESH
jgi:hypothetical protein